MEEGWPVELPGRRRVQLAYWGRYTDGRWWAHLWWWAPAEPFRPAEAELAGQQVLCDGWTWSSSVRPLAGVDYTGVPRLELAASPDSWPSPAADWAATAGAQVRHHGLMGLPLGSPPDEPDPEPAPRRRQREPGTGRTLAERAAGQPRHPAEA